MKYINHLFLSSFIFLMACSNSADESSSKLNQEQALKFYEVAKYQCTNPCFALMEGQYKSMKGIMIAAVEQNSVSEDELANLRNTEKEVIEELNKAIKKIEALQDPGGSSKVKEATLEYLNILLEFEKTAVSPSIEILEGGIEESENEELLMRLSLVKEMKAANSSFENVQRAFIEECNFSNEQFKELDNKYGI